MILVFVETDMHSQRVLGGYSLTEYRVPNKSLNGRLANEQKKMQRLKIKRTKNERAR